MRWSLQQVGEALGARLPESADGNARIEGVSIDSRTIRPGELFIAIAGPQHDGHKFLEAALKAGAPAAVVSVEWAKGSGRECARDFAGRLIEVDDTFAALQKLAAAVLAQWRKGNPNRKVGAVAGSLGKTTTKEILAALVGVRYPVLKSAGNLNNEFGLPLTLLRLEDDHEAVVVELGMSRKGELARLTQLAKPDVAAITRIAAEHLEFFESIEEVAKAERELIENLPVRDGRSESVSVLNGDDDQVVGFAEVARGPVVWFSCEPGLADAQRRHFRAENIEDRGIDGTAFDLVSGGRRERMELALIGRHNVMNAVAAYGAASSGWGITAEEARKVFAGLKPADKRGEVIRFAGFTVVDDSYNSSPTALNAVADTLAQARSYKRRILAAGEMLELGEAAAQLHRDCGAYAAQTGGIDWLIGVRGHALDFVNGAIAAGFEAQRARFFDTSEAAADFLAGFVKQGDLLLVKGSRGVKMEKIVYALRAKHEAKASEAEEKGSTGSKREPVSTGSKVTEPKITHTKVN